MIKYSLAAIALALVPGVAMAQDSSAFGGPYVGAIVGYDHVKVGGGGASDSKDGVTFGGIVGWDMNLGGGIVGAEAEISGSTTKQEETDVFVLGDRAKLKAGRDLYVGIRAGVLAAPTTLIYVKGGYTNARATLDYDNGAGSTFSASDNLDGFRIGAGVEQAFGRLKARIEYRYSDYGEAKYNGVGLGVDAKRHQVVAGLTASF